MANKKAKKTSKKSTAVTASKVTTTTKVVTKELASDSKPNLLKSFVKPKDLKSIFSAETLSVLFVEMIGSMALAMMYAYSRGNAFYLMFAVAVMILALSNFAILFFNPIFAVGAWLTKKISAQKALLTVVAQALGVMLAWILLSKFIQAVPEASDQAAMLGQPKPELFRLEKIAEKKEWFVFFSEMIGATILGFLAAQAYKRSAGEKAAIISGAMFVAWFVSSSLSVYVQQNINLLNPILAISTVKFGKDWQWNTAVYIIAPLLGGALGVFINKILVKDSSVKTSIKTA